jgi:PTS system fructose-specific IIC component
MTTSTGASVLDSSLYIPELKPRRRHSVLQELVARASHAGALRAPSLLLETLQLRERLAPSAIGRGAAVPHARSIAVREPRVVVARSQRGIDWGAIDEEPVHVVLLVLSPAIFSEELHVDFVGRVAAVARLQRNRQRLLEASEFAGIQAVLADVTA